MHWYWCWRQRVKCYWSFGERWCWYSFCCNRLHLQLWWLSWFKAFSSLECDWCHFVPLRRPCSTQTQYCSDCPPLEMVVLQLPWHVELFYDISYVINNFSCFTRSVHVSNAVASLSILEIVAVDHQMFLLADLFSLLFGVLVHGFQVYLLTWTACADQFNLF